MFRLQVQAKSDVIRLHVGVGHLEQRLRRTRTKVQICSPI